MSMEEYRTEIKKINTKQIIVSPAYQRTVDFNRVKRMVSDYNPNLVNLIKVSYRGGKYYCFDGQHTMSMLKALNGNKDLQVQCKVYYGMSLQDEARLFADQNGIFKAVPSAQRMKSLYVSKDVDIVDFKNTVESCGIKCDFGNAGGTKRLACYSTAFQIFKKRGSMHLINILNVALGAWDGAPDSFSKEVISGLDVFMRTYDGEYNEKLLIKRLKTISPTVIRREGKAFSTGGNTRFARVIFDIYNKNTSTGRLEYKF